MASKDYREPEHDARLSQVEQNEQAEQVLKMYKLTSTNMDWMGWFVIAKSEADAIEHIRTDDSGNSSDASTWTAEYEGDVHDGFAIECDA
jgi:hypothetical protein